MPEEMEVGVDRLQDAIEERRHDAGEHAAHGHASAGGAAHRSARPRWLDYLAISTALFAVIAAIAALESGNYANESLFQANRAVLLQTRAVDTWSQYQAESIKKYEATNLVTILAHTGGSPREIGAARAEAARRQKQQSALQPEARRLNAETDTLNKESEGQLEHHHRFAIAVTLLQVAIGLSAIAALLSMPAVWYFSLGAGAFALLVFVDGFTKTI